MENNQPKRLSAEEIVQTCTGIKGMTWEMWIYSDSIIKAMQAFADQEVAAVTAAKDAEIRELKADKEQTVTPAPIGATKQNIMEIKTLLDLKNALSQYSDEQLQKAPAVLVGEDAAYKIMSVEPLDFDLYTSKDDPEDCGPIEELKEYHGEDFNIEDYYVCQKKGEIRMYQDF
jgi:hypothetical protein